MATATDRLHSATEAARTAWAEADAAARSEGFGRTAAGPGTRPATGPAAGEPCERGAADAARAAALDDAEHQELRRRVKDLDDEEARVAELLDDPELAAAAAVPPPDLAALEAALARAEEHHQAVGLGPRPLPAPPRPPRRARRRARVTAPAPGGPPPNATPSPDASRR